MGKIDEEKWADSRNLMENLWAISLPFYRLKNYESHLTSFINCWIATHGGNVSSTNKPTLTLAGRSLFKTQNRFSPVLNIVCLPVFYRNRFSPVCLPFYKTQNRFSPVLNTVCLPVFYRNRFSPVCLPFYKHRIDFHLC